MAYTTWCDDPQRDEETEPLRPVGVGDAVVVEESGEGIVKRFQEGLVAVVFKGFGERQVIGFLVRHKL